MGKCVVCGKEDILLYHWSDGAVCSPCDDIRRNSYTKPDKKGMAMSVCYKCVEDLAFDKAVGKKTATDKPDYTLIPPNALLAIAQVFTFGIKKHPANDWRERRGHLAAAMRHIEKHRMGEVIDLDSGLPHLAHAIVRLMMMMETKEKK